MGGVISILVCVAAAYLAHRDGKQIIFWLATVLGILNFWSVGVMHNYASMARRNLAARLRENLASEGVWDEKAEKRIGAYERGVEPRAVPNWLAALSLVLGLLGLILLVVVLI